jgi:hypothetical protein
VSADEQDDEKAKPAGATTLRHAGLVEVMSEPVKFQGRDMTGMEALTRSIRDDAIKGATFRKRDAARAHLLRLLFPDAGKLVDSEKLLESTTVDGKPWVPNIVYRENPKRAELGTSSTKKTDGDDE